MKYITVFLIAVTLALIGKSLLGISLMFAFISSVALQFEMKESLIIAFWSGIAASIVNNSILGRESIGFLIVVGLIQIYRQKVARHWMFMIIIVLIASVLNHLILGRELLFKRVVLDGVLTLIFMFLARGVKRKLFSDQIVVKI